MVTIVQASLLLPIGIGQVGVGQDHLGADEERSHFAEQLVNFTQPLTRTDTAVCVDERPVERLADGTSDPLLLHRDVLPQLEGGLGLATTKALIAANASALGTPRDIMEAYFITTKLLQAMGFEDAAHAGCGASDNVERAIAVRPSFETRSSVLVKLGALSEKDEALFATVEARQATLLNEGFYGTWDADKHADYVSTTYPQNFSYLSGVHHGSGLYIPAHGYGLSKQAFIEQTGRQCFVYTASFISAEDSSGLAYKLGTTGDERRRIELAFLDGLLGVGNVLFAPDMPVFASH